MIQILISLAVAMLSAVGLFFLIMPYQWMSNKSIKVMNRMPGPKQLPILGSIFEFNLKHEEVLPKILSMTAEYGRVFKVWILGHPTVFLSDPDDAEIIVTSKQHIDKSIAYDFIQPWLGTGLLTSTGSKWHTRRKILTPAFHFKILEDYVNVFNVNSRILVERLQEQRDKYINVNTNITLCTLDIICETAMGISVNAQKGEQQEYIRAVKRMSELFQHRYMSFWLHKDFVYKWSPSGREQVGVLKTLHGFTEKVIRQRRKEFRANKMESTSGKKLLSFLDILIEVSEKEGDLSDLDIREEVDTFMFEGHDTTAQSMSWCLFLLGHHPEIQEKIFEELDRVFGSDDRDPSMIDLQSLPYMDKVIKETLRLYPSVPAISRQIMHDVTIKNFTITAGSIAAIFPYLLHRNPKYFPEPEVFNPENFSPERLQGRHPYVYIPFSAGPRNCIGQKFAMLEEKAILSAIFRKFRVTSLEKRENVKILMEMVLTPMNGLQLKFESRF